MSTPDGHERTREDLTTEIAHQRDQIEHDSDLIAKLEASRVVDQAAIADLEAQAVVDRDLIARLESEGVIDRNKIDNLEFALIAARRIGMGMGILMAAHRITADAAFGMLRDASQHSGRKIREIAEDVIEAGGVV